MFGSIRFEFRKMGGSSSKTEKEENQIKGDENKNENGGLFQITFEHVSGSFMTLFVIGLIIALFLVLRWFRKRGRHTTSNRTLDMEAQWGYSAPPGRPRRVTTENEPRMEMEKLPKLFLVSNTAEASLSTQTWSPSQARLKSQTNPV